MTIPIEYLPDACIDVAQDRELRGLLTTCFTGPQDVVFKTRRYFHEPYPHRWVIRDERGAVVAHIGVHDKKVEAGGEIFRFGGIGEVCVHPDHRGRGYVRETLAVIHDWLARHGFAFSVLYGNPEVYGSSGYVAKENVFCREAVDQAPQRRTVLVKQLTGEPWPVADAYLQGVTF